MFVKIWQYAPQFLPWVRAIMVLLVGHVIIRLIVRIVKKACTKAKLDASLVSFIGKTISLFLHTLIVLSALSSIGVSTTGLVATLSAAVVAVGLALKDSLGNIAGGVLLLLSPRFVTGDYIATDSDSGSVVKVDLLHTTLRTPDNRIISIPNGVLINSNITNYSAETKRRVDLDFGIPYEADAEFAKTVILETVCAHNKVICEPAEPMARVHSYGDSAVKLVVRCWCEATNYWDVYFDLTEQIRAALEEKNISIPYNQLDVRIVKND